MKRSRLSASSSEEDEPSAPLSIKRSAKKFEPQHWAEQNKQKEDNTNVVHQLPKISKHKEMESTNNSVDSKAQKMMAMMGYKKGHGLGKHNQGRVAPVELSTQRGRRGLGLHLKGLEPANLEWDSSQEVVTVEEKIRWLAEDGHVPITLAQMRAWMREGPPKKTLDDESDFCDPDVLRNILSGKSVFDLLDKNELIKARSKSNPFETIGRAFFLNRAAMKMANMDAVFGFMFTNPLDQAEQPMLGPNDILYFADVCAGPGGFSEYVLWRKQWEAKGFGMTLRESNDFKLEDFHAAPCESFEPFYGTKGDGNVYDPENIDSLQRLVLENTDGHGVHFMMADGGFCVDGEENIQEILSKRLYLCQCLVALSIVRSGGHFVCKLFDLFTPFSVGLMYLLHKAFHQIAIHKPNTSRPANSERYVVCKWRRDDCDAIRDYMYEVNLRLQKTDKVDVLELVPVSVLKEDEAFYDFIVYSNNSLGERQIINLLKIRAFCQDVNLTELRQAEMKKGCLAFWQVPDKTRTAPKHMNVEDKLRIMLQHTKVGWMVAPNKDLVPESLDLTFSSLYDWRCMVLAGNKQDKNVCTFFLGMGRGHKYMLDQDKKRWIKCILEFDLAPDTLLYGEIVNELRGESRSQVKISVLQVIDAFFLGGKDISALHLKERHELCHKFAKAMNKGSKPGLTSISVKELFRLEDICQVFDRLETKNIKSYGGQKKLAYMLGGSEDRFFLPSGLLFFKTTLEPWIMAFSRSQNRKYWFHTRKNLSTFVCPMDSVASFVSCFENRVMWWWDEGVALHLQEDACNLPGKVHRDTIIRRVETLLPK